MGDGVGVLELCQEAWIGERDARDALARERTAHFHRRRLMRIGQHRLLQADLVKGAEDVGAELDTGTDLAKLRRLLDHPHGNPFERECMRCRQSADPSACDQDREPLTIRFNHPRSNRCHAQSLSLRRKLGHQLIELGFGQRRRQIFQAHCVTSNGVQSGQSIRINRLPRIELVARAPGLGQRNAEPIGVKLEAVVAEVKPARCFGIGLDEALERVAPGRQRAALVMFTRTV